MNGVASLVDNTPAPSTPAPSQPSQPTPQPPSQPTPQPATQPSADNSNQNIYSYGETTIKNRNEACDPEFINGYPVPRYLRESIVKSGLLKHNNSTSDIEDKRSIGTMQYYIGRKYHNVTPVRINLTVSEYEVKIRTVKEWREMLGVSLNSVIKDAASIIGALDEAGAKIPPHITLTAEFLDSVVPEMSSMEKYIHSITRSKLDHEMVPICLSLSLYDVIVVRKTTNSNLADPNNEYSEWEAITQPMKKYFDI